MFDSTLMLSEIRRRAARVPKLLRRSYRGLYARNKILQFRSRERTDRYFASAGKRFAVFLVPGGDIINGGIMSICSIATETRKLLADHGVSVAVCTGYDEPRFLQFTKFDNSVEVLAFADLLPRFPVGAEVLVHIPEFCVRKFVADRLDVYRSRPDIKWQFNILLQNIDATPRKEAVEALKQFTFTTATIAHKASSSAAQELGLPVHFLSWFISAEDFQRVGFADKRKLVVISPDSHPAKAEVVRRIAAAVPDHKIVEIRNMTYREYKSVIRDAKFTFTFGEGLDGYFVESIYSGAVSMAIFDERYFTPEYRDLTGVFRDTGTAIAEVAEFLLTNDNLANFKAVQERQYDLVAKTFRRAFYESNLRDFYAQYVPHWSSPPSR